MFSCKFNNPLLCTRILLSTELFSHPYHYNNQQILEDERVKRPNTRCVCFADNEFTAAVN